jgi:hypothetical protein
MYFEWRCECARIRITAVLKALVPTGTETPFELVQYVALADRIRSVAAACHGSTLQFRIRPECEYPCSMRAARRLLVCEKEQNARSEQDRSRSTLSGPCDVRVPIQPEFAELAAKLQIRDEALFDSKRPDWISNVDRGCGFDRYFSLKRSLSW